MNCKYFNLTLLYANGKMINRMAVAEMASENPSYRLRG